MRGPIKTAWHAVNIPILPLSALPYPLHCWLGTCQCHWVMQECGGLRYPVCSCSRLPPQSSSTAQPARLHPPASISRFHTASLDLRIQRSGRLQQSIPQWYIVGGFPQMQVFLFHQMGKLNSAALDRVQTDTETQTRLVSASSTCSGADGGARLQGA